MASETCSPITAARLALAVLVLAPAMSVRTAAAQAPQGQNPTPCRLGGPPHSTIAQVREYQRQYIGITQEIDLLDEALSDVPVEWMRDSIATDLLKLDPHGRAVVETVEGVYHLKKWLDMRSLRDRLLKRRGEIAREFRDHYPKQATTFFDWFLHRCHYYILKVKKPSKGYVAGYYFSCGEEGPLQLNRCSTNVPWDRFGVATVTLAAYPNNYGQYWNRKFLSCSGCDVPPERFDAGRSASLTLVMRSDRTISVTFG